MAEIKLEHVTKRYPDGYEAVKEKNPGIVYCSISAFGQDGAYPGRAAHDLALEAMTGVLSLTLGDDGRPAIPGIPVADLVSGLHGLSGVLMALLRRQTTGKGDYIDVSMHEALMASCANVVGNAFTDGTQPEVKQQRTTGGSAFYRIYDTRDGRQLVLADNRIALNAGTAVRKFEGDANHGRRWKWLGRQHIHAAGAQVEQDALDSIALIDPNRNRRLDSDPKRLPSFALQQRRGSAQGILSLLAGDGLGKDEMSACA